MKVSLTDEAFRNLEDIRSYLAEHYPTVAPNVEEHLRALFERLGEWPESAPAVADRPGVRKASLSRYPYNVFYRIMDQTVEILYIYHSARQEPWADKNKSN